MGSATMTERNVITKPRERAAPALSLRWTPMRSGA
jgi:hypothetical protein